MRVLLACECSGTVRDAFLALGHDAMSCDLLPTEKPGPHYKGDVMDLKGEPWDLVIAFPPCTYLSFAGMAHWNKPGRTELRAKAVEFARQFEEWAPKVAIENPQGHLQNAWRRPDQRINPNQFGDPYLKRTCLWLKHLPPLISTALVVAERRWVPCGGSGEKRMPSVNNDAKTSAKTFPGIAAAMADQWGNL
jgi:hypothetical protein